MLKLSVPVEHEDERPVVNDNISLVTDIMTFSPQGALSQVFVVEAIMYYAQHVLKADPKEFDVHPMIHPEAWKRTASDIERRMTAFYNRHNAPEAT